MKITAAVLHEKTQPFALEELEMDAPQGHEVLVKIVATGMCRTDLKIRYRDKSDPFIPIVLGHEGAGIVEQVGDQVSKVRPGDSVVLSYDFCGNCNPCGKGIPFYCDSALAMNFGGFRLDGTTPLHQQGNPIRGAFFGQSSFASHSIVTERNIVKVDQTAPLELLGPLGCSIQTGAGGVFNALRPKPGSSIAIFGSGPVGLSAVMAAKIIGCEKIIVVDLKPNRLKLAQRLGATHTIEATHIEVVEVIRQITQGGTDYALETTGLISVFQQAVDSIAPKGICGFVTPPQGTENGFDLAKIFFGKRIFGIIQGESLPERIIPELIQLYQRGRFPFDQLVQFYPFDQINRASQDFDQGLAVKPVLRMNA